MTQHVRLPRGSFLFPPFAVLPLLIASILAFGACAGHRALTEEERKAREEIDLADRFIQAGNYSEAERLLLDSIRLDSKNAEAFYYLGVAHFYLNEPEAAEKALRESLRLRERSPDTHNALGLVYVKRGDFTRALSEYDTALSDASLKGPERVMLNRGLCLDAMGRTEEAIAQLRRSVEANPKYYAAHYELAKLLDRQEQTREAIEEYEVAAIEYASDPAYHYRLGLAYFRDHKPEKAREHLSKVISALPGSEKAAKAKEILALIDAGPTAYKPEAKR